MANTGTHWVAAATEAEEELKLAPYGVTLAQSILIHGVKEFRPEKRVRK